MAAYADRSPASVFGASTPATAADSSLKNSGVSGTRSKKDSVAAVVSEEEWRITAGAKTSDHQQANDIKAGSSRQQQKIADLKSKKASVVSKRESDVDNAIRALQQQSRVRRLYAQEKAHEHEAQTLRRALEKASIALLSQSFQRYRLRCAISLYVCRFEREEDAVRRLLQQVEQAKLRKEAVVSRRRQERDQQAQRAAQFLWTWYTFHRLIRRDRAKRIHSESRIACWWRSIRLYRRCQSRHRVKEAASKRVIQRSIQRYTARQEFLRDQYRARIERSICRFLVRKRLAEARTQSHIEGARRLAKILRTRYLARISYIWKDQISRMREQIKQQQRQMAAARVLQQFFRQVAVYNRQRARIVLVQSIARRHHARRRHLQCRAARKHETELKERAVTRIQARIRGMQQRVRYANILRLLRERFQCSNCGVIEPGGVYCKQCGRRRTNFEPLRFSSVQCTRNKLRSPPVSAMIPTPPAAQRQSYVRSIRIGRHRRLSVPSSCDRFPSVLNGNGDLLSVGALTTLPAILSPRHHPTAFPAPAVPVQTVVSASTKLRAQALVGLQLQHERAGHTQAMNLHLQRLQRGSQVVRRSVNRLQ